MQTAVDLVKQLKEEKIAAEAAAEAAAAAAAAEAEREAAAAANQDALDLNEALNTTPPVPDFQSSFAQVRSALFGFRFEIGLKHGVGCWLWCSMSVVEKPLHPWFAWDRHSNMEYLLLRLR